MNESLSIIPMGGLGEIGMNMTLFGVGDDWFVVDAGVQFCEAGTVGAEVSLQDLDLLASFRDRIKAIIITHGHEDHIGALEHVYPVCDAPVYAPPFARELIQLKAAEFGAASRPEIQAVGPGDRIDVGTVSIEFIRMTHSIPDCLGLAMVTPFGTVVHTGDFKFEPHPLDGRMLDSDRLRELGDAGVRLMLSDSTNAMVEGHTRSETDVLEAVESEVRNAPGRVIVSLFASNAFRVRAIAEAAARNNRRVSLVGRSLHIYQEAAARADLARDIPDLVDPSRIDQVPDQDLLIICTGSQAESRSVLFQASRDDHRFLRIRPGDLVIMSSKIIPGNERIIHRMVNSLMRLGARVLNEKMAPIHASGHACRDELREMIRLVRPRAFVPVHGEYAFLRAHADLAAAEGVEDVRVIENGDVLEIDDREAVVTQRLALNCQFVDGPLVGDADDLRLAERRRMGWTGVVAARLKRVKGRKGPGRFKVDVRSVGCPFADDEMLEEAGRFAAAEVVSMPVAAGRDQVEETLVRAIRTFFRKRLERKPLVMTFVDLSKD
ncbi:MAG: ribonuclease J [Deltaproteobacteria bacterium]|nr:ribonuclease J [Deltaproteobacteria bacterium]